MAGSTHTCFIGVRRGSVAVCCVGRGRVGFVSGPALSAFFMNGIRFEKTQPCMGRPRDKGCVKRPKYWFFFKGEKIDLLIFGTLILVAGKDGRLAPVFFRKFPYKKQNKKTSEK